MKTEDTLYSLTEANHKACMAHAVGQRMLKGAVTRQEWADWLWAFRILHMVVDRGVPETMRRETLLNADLAMLPSANVSPSALYMAAQLAKGGVVGAAYVLHGAHRSGGRQMASVMAAAGLPTHHIFYPNQAEAQNWVRDHRDKVQWADQANATFAHLLGVMDEIEARSTPA